MFYEHSRQSFEAKISLIFALLARGGLNLHGIVQKADEKSVSVKEGDRIANLEAKSNSAVFALLA